MEDSHVQLDLSVAPGDSNITLVTLVEHCRSCGQHTVFHSPVVGVIS